MKYDINCNDIIDDEGNIVVYCMDCKDFHHDLNELRNHILYNGEYPFVGILAKKIREKEKEKEKKLYVYVCPDCGRQVIIDYKLTEEQESNFMCNSCGDTYNDYAGW